MKAMQQVFGLAVALGAAALSACGGEATPAHAQTSYTASDFQASLNWPATGAGAFGGNTSFGITAMLVTIPYAGTQYQDIGLVTDQASFGVALAPPSPLPTGVIVPTPQPSAVLQIRSNPVQWSVSAANAVITPAPQFSAMLGPTVIVAPGAQTGKSQLTATAVGPPVDVGVSVSVYTYRVADVGCVDAGAMSGASFVPDADGGHYSAQTDPAASDLYVTGPACAGAFADPSGYTVHVPYGGMLTNLDGNPSNEQNNGFYTFDPSGWHSDFTQLAQSQFQTLLNPCSVSPDPRVCFTRPNDVLIFKTRDGNVVKMYVGLTQHTLTDGRTVAGAFEVSSNGRFPF